MDFHHGWPTSIQRSGSSGCVVDADKLPGTAAVQALGYLNSNRILATPRRSKSSLGDVRGLSCIRLQDAEHDRRQEQQRV